MKFLLLSVLASSAVNTATCYTTVYTKGFTARPTTFLAAEIRPPSSKAKELRFGWDGTTALGGAEVDSKPARMLDDIKASGETLHPDGGENGNRRLIRRRRWRRWGNRIKTLNNINERYLTYPVP